jgi:hypothetical protein
MRAHLLPLAFAAVCASGCGDDIPGPSPTNLRVSLRTIGADPDADGYLVHIGDTPARRVQPDAFLNVLLAKGDYDVRVDELASNCAVTGPESVRVAVVPGQLAVVEFRVECGAVTAAVEVMAPTSGRDWDLEGYPVRVDDGSGTVLHARVLANNSFTVTGLGAGTYVVSLGPSGPNCALDGPGSRTVSVTVGGLVRDTARASFQVACTAVTGDVDVTVATAGAPSDPDGYTLHIDGELVQVFDYYFYGYGSFPLRILSGGSYLDSRVEPGDHTYELTDIAPNCAVGGSNPATVSVAVGAVSAIAFNVTCT